jgi:predicted ribosome quality control (RQC) complex YloA/Tae2 family protein
MSMTWDSLLTAAVARELHGALAGDRLRAIHLDHAGRSALLHFRRSTLVARLAPDDGRIVLGEVQDPLEEARPLAADVVEVEAPPDDRILLLRMRRPRGRREPVLVVLELMTQQWNLVVARGPDLRVRHLFREREGARVLRTGHPYRPPPPSDREGRDGELSLERWRAILDPPPPGDRRGALLSGIAWTSPLNAPALLGEAARARGPEAQRDLDAGWELWNRLVERRRDPEPGLLHRKGERQPWVAPLPDRPWEPASTVLAAVAAAGDPEAATGAPALPHAWIEALEKRVRAARGKARGLERELEKTRDPERWRRRGDLLLARFNEIPRGAGSVTLTDFQGQEVEITLDPSLTPQENAARYYDRAARAERTRERLPAMLEEARRTAREEEAFLERVRAGEADPEEVRERLPARGSQTAADAAASLPYRRFRSSGGLEIRVGKGAKSNDDLTFHHSRPDDVWLHARHAAGAHVILRWAGDGSPPARDLAQAATLAALASKARTSGSVPVDWTRRKYVRKPRKAPPGAVVPDRVQTVFVEPDAELEERLLDEP